MISLIPNARHSFGTGWGQELRRRATGPPGHPLRQKMQEKGGVVGDDHDDRPLMHGRGVVRICRSPWSEAGQAPAQTSPAAVPEPGLG